MTMYIPGVGDIETWGMPTGHPNDPRTEERTPDDIENEADDMALRILGDAARGVAHLHDPRDRLAQHVGRLQGEIRSLCSQLAWARESQ